MPPPMLEMHIRAFGRFLLEREVESMSEVSVGVGETQREARTKRETRAAWKLLEKQYGRDRVKLMKRLAKHGGASFRHFETVETRLSV